MCEWVCVKVGRGMCRSVGKMITLSHDQACDSKGVICTNDQNNTFKSVIVKCTSKWMKLSISHSYQGTRLGGGVRTYVSWSRYECACWKAGVGVWNGALAMLTGSKDIRCVSSLVHRPLPRVFTFTQEKKSDAIVNANEKKKTTKTNDDNNNNKNKNKTKTTNI